LGEALFYDRPLWEKKKKKYRGKDRELILGTVWGGYGLS